MYCFRIDSDWKIPSLKEVIEMLSYNMPVVQQNAAAYLQHLSYCDDETKTNVRKLGNFNSSSLFSQPVMIV